MAHGYHQHLSCGVKSNLTPPLDPCCNSGCTVTFKELMMSVNKLSRVSISVLLCIHFLLFVTTFFTHHTDTKHPFLVIVLALYLFFPLWRLHQGKRWPLALYGATCMYLSFLPFWLCQAHQLSLATSISVALTLCLIQYATIISFYVKPMLAWWPVSTKSKEKKQALEAAIYGENIKAIKPRSIRWASYLITLNFIISLCIIIKTMVAAHIAHLLSNNEPAILIIAITLSSLIFFFYIWRINVGERWLIYPTLIIFILKTIAIIAIAITGELPKPYESLLINPVTPLIAGISFILTLVSFRFLFSASARAWSQSLKIQQLQYDVSQARNTEHNLYLVDPLKLTIMTIVTCGFYLYHWFYRHWKAIQANEHHAGKPRIMPVARSLLQNLFVFPFLSRLYPNKRLSYTLSFFLFFSGMLSIEKAFNPLVLLPMCIWLYIIQHRTNTIAQLSGVDREVNDTYSWLNWLFIGLFLVLMAYKTFSFFVA